MWSASSCSSPAPSLPLTLVHFSVFGVEVSLAVILALPVLVYWLMLDAGIGLGILAAMIVLLSVATAIGNQVSIVMMWSIFAVLIVLGVASQIVGHRVFEERQPSMVDHPTHFLLGPMFVMAKLLHCTGLPSRPCRDSGASSDQLPFNPIAFSKRNSKTYFMALVLVTGGSGFIGQHLVEALRARGQRVRVLDVRPPAARERRR